MLLLGGDWVLQSINSIDFDFYSYSNANSNSNSNSNTFTLLSFGLAILVFAFFFWFALHCMHYIPTYLLCRLGLDAWVVRSEVPRFRLAALVALRMCMRMGAFGHARKGSVGGSFGKWESMKVVRLVVRVGACPTALSPCCLD